MPQISRVSTYDEAESVSGESDHTSVHSRCNSSNSIFTTAAVQTEQNWEVSTSTAWTDSKHSSYLDFMEANFVKNMFGNSYCAEDLCGKTSSYQHQHVDIEEEYDDDSAQSQLHIPYETMEFKMCDPGDRTIWRPASRFPAPAGMHWFLLSNPWVKHFRPKNTSTAPLTLLSSRKGEVMSITSFSPKQVFGSVEHLQRVNTHDVAVYSNPSISNTKKRALCSTNEQTPATRQKPDKEVKGNGIGTINQEVAFPSKLT